MFKIKLWAALLCTSVIFFSLTGCHRTNAYDVEGNAIRLSDYQNQWIIVNYWAAWCKPCLSEMPDFDAFYQQHKNNVVVFGVNYDHLPDEDVRAFAKKLNIHFPLLRSFPAENFGVQEISVIPMTLVIAPHQKFIKVLHGPQSKLDLEDMIQDGFYKSSPNHSHE